jgi:hypothetical protein
MKFLKKTGRDIFWGNVWFLLPVFRWIIVNGRDEKYHDKFAISVLISRWFHLGISPIFQLNVQF